MEDEEIKLGEVSKFFKKKNPVEESEQKIEQAESRVNEEIKEAEQSPDRTQELESLYNEKEQVAAAKEVISEEKEKLDIIHQEEKEIEKEKAAEIQVIEEQNEKLEKIEDDVVDFGKLGRKVKGWFKFEKKMQNNDNVFSEDTSLDFKKSGSETIKFFKKNKYALPVLLIIIAIFFSTFFRMYPAYLPITDDWAKESVNRFYQNQVEQEINKQYPNLPAANKAGLIENNLAEVLRQNKGTYDEQVKQTSQQFKSRLQNDNDQTYLLAIDPYFWFNHARNYINNGHLGNGFKDGESWNYQRFGRVGKPITDLKLHPLLIAWSYKIMSVFNNDLSLLKVAFFMPVLLI